VCQQSDFEVKAGERCEATRTKKCNKRQADAGNMKNTEQLRVTNPAEKRTKIPSSVAPWFVAQLKKANN